MLHEITKGMPNASQAINENFKQLEIESGSNENSYWVDLPDGTRIVYGVFRIDRSSGGSDTTQMLPKAFIDGKYSVVLNPNSNSVTFMRDVHSLIAAPINASTFRVLRTPHHEFISGGEMDVRYMATGRYK